MSDSFIAASRQKIRFSTGRGQLCVEDLWDLDIDRLDGIAVSVATAIDEVNAATSRSFIPGKNKKANDFQKESDLRLEILKHIITTKAAEAEARKLTAVNASKRAFLENLLEKKQIANMESLTEEEIQAQLAACTA